MDGPGVPGPSTYILGYTTASGPSTCSTALAHGCGGAGTQRMNTRASARVFTRTRPRARDAHVVRVVRCSFRHPLCYCWRRQPPARGERSRTSCARARAQLARTHCVRAKLRASARNFVLLLFGRYLLLRRPSTSNERTDDRRAYARRSRGVHAARYARAPRAHIVRPRSHEHPSLAASVACGAEEPLPRWSAATATQRERARDARTARETSNAHARGCARVLACRRTRSRLRRSLDRCS